MVFTNTKVVNKIAINNNTYASNWNNKDEKEKN